MAEVYHLIVNIILSVTLFVTGSNHSDMRTLLDGAHHVIGIN